MEQEHDQFDDEPSFSLNDFKKWMASQTDKPAQKSRRHSELVGLQAESKISVKRLINKITAEEGDVHELASDFRQYGGIILDVDKDDNLTIEVDSGTFVIPKFFVRKSR
jgi:hypothetical protein